MAVDSKHGAKNNGVNGATASGQATAGGRRRPSSLMAVASMLPTVEHSLEEFIAKANQTLVDVSTWGSADQQARQEDDKRRELDAQRMKAAESQMREGEVREQSLRRQLDGLQGQLAEAEARAAVAGTAVGSAAHDAALSQLRIQIQQAEDQRIAAEKKTQSLAQALEQAKTEVQIARTSATAIDTDLDAADRIRVAEAKAAKAIAVARAAQAGLTVSPADIAAIESGLVVPSQEAPRTTPWVAILAAFVGGLILMFGVWKLVLEKPAAPAPATAAGAQPTVTQPAVTQPAATPAADVAPSKPVVTPIEDPAPAADPAAAAAQAAADQAAADQAAADQAAAAKAAADQAAAAKAAAKKPAAKKPAAKKPATKPTSGGIADPFATPAKKPTKPAAKPAASGIVDPF